MKKIGIIGVGWLGEYLVNQIDKKKFNIWGTVSTEEKALKLTGSGFPIVSYQLGETPEKLMGCKEVDIFLITIPPSVSDQYVNLLKELIQYLKKQSPEAKLIYTSSTSVYGKAVREVYELSETEAVTKNAQKMEEVERFLQEQYKNDSYILRLGGLVGGERHPVKYLSGRKNIAKPFAPVNLVHRKDIVRLIFFIAEGKIDAGIINFSSPEHPEKNKYYEWAAKKLDIEKPLFNFADKSSDKTVICKAVQSAGFQFEYQSPYEFPL